MKMAAGSTQRMLKRLQQAAKRRKKATITGKSGSQQIETSNSNFENGGNRGNGRGNRGSELANAGNGQSAAGNGQSAAGNRFSAATSRAPAACDHQFSDFDYPQPLQAITERQPNAQQGPNRLQGPQSGEHQWKHLNKRQVDNLRLFFQKSALTDQFFVPPFSPDDTETVEWLWETLATILEISPEQARRRLTNLPLEMTTMYKTTVQLHRSNLMTVFNEKFVAADPYKLNNDERKALDLITDEALFLYLEVGDSQRLGPQLFMNDSFLKSVVLFFKVSHVTRTMTVSRFLQARSMHVLACIACCVRHAIDLVAVKRRDLTYATKSGKLYQNLLDTFNYEGDDDELQQEHEIVVEGLNRFYEAMTSRLLPNNENESGRLKFRR
ncbi:hypothetical protein BDR26DRAFT_924879 [Obelidium mucronatum]|nr:hypothetical protein BDR26DRAFT_924879 [Obelidium mucronatum]